MPAQILHLGATVLCSHGAPATPVSTFPRVTLSGQPLVTVANPYSIAGCSSDPPCATGQWTSGATRVTAGGAPVAIFSGQSTSVPNGTPMSPVTAQTRVLAT
jgi:hypothetical protein